ncbi:MAG TPA: Hpt domain-containing protein [Polyangium sp.]|nr:Hpt domain-containing protein [Polyangium sp.]
MGDGEMESAASTLESTPMLDSEVVESLRGLELFDELAKIFLDELPTRLNEIVEACHQSNVAMLEDTAHSLKGSCLAIGAMRLGKLCAQLQAQAPRPASEGVLALVKSIMARKL